MAEIGATYRDKITGFAGVATGRCEYISGCTQVLLAPKAKDNKFEEEQWFDEQRLERQGDEKITLDNGDTPGFDRAPPKR